MYLNILNDIEIENALEIINMYLIIITNSVAMLSEFKFQH